MNNASTKLPSSSPPKAAAADGDLADQARPGHGVPSQDTNPAAQIALEPEEAQREANSVLAGGGAVGGVAIGTAIGVVVGGPVGAVVGSAVGAVVGALGGAAAGAVMKTGDSGRVEPVPEGGPPASKVRPAIAGGVKP